jgi:hypothetical protein
MVMVVGVAMTCKWDGSEDAYTGSLMLATDACVDWEDEVLEEAMSEDESCCERWFSLRVARRSCC